MAEIKYFKAYVGTNEGILKGITGNSEFQNLLKHKSKENFGIFKVLWTNLTLNKVIIVYANGNICHFDISLNKHKIIGKIEQTSLVGFEIYNKHFISCSKEGHIKIFDKKCVLLHEFQCGANVHCIQRSSKPNYLLACGGKGNNLEIYDIKRLLVGRNLPIFMAKNVPNDNLDLSIPVWITGIAFLSGTNKIATSTAFHQIRIYEIPGHKKDTLTTTRGRPILDMDIGENPFTCLTYVPQKFTLLAGDTKGLMVVIELKSSSITTNGNKAITQSTISNEKYVKLMAHKYIAKKRYIHSSNGAIINIVSLPVNDREPEIFTISKDRYLRTFGSIGDLKKPQSQVYLKSNPTCILQQPTTLKKTITI